MIRITLSLVFVFLSVTIKAQTYKDDVKTQFLNYTDSLIKKEFLKSMDYLNPAFLKIIPKDQLLKLMEQTFNNPEMEIKMEQANVLSVGEKKAIDGNNYVKLVYTNLLGMRFISEAGKAIDTVQMKKALQHQFGDDKVNYESSSQFYWVSVTKNVVANSKDDKKWTFVVVEEKQKAILERFIPKELL